MNELYLTINIKSDTLVGSGTGCGAVIDEDVVFDDIGLPFIPAKRIKGCLRDAALEISDMISVSSNEKALKFKSLVNNVFGKSIDNYTPSVYFSNLTLLEYDETKQWMNWALNHEKIKNYISPDSILNSFTVLRQQTSIDEDFVAKKHSLRRFRLLKKGLSFKGKVEMPDDVSKESADIIALAAKNLSHIGTNRNKGYGLIECSLLDSNPDRFLQNFIKEDN